MGGSWQAVMQPPNLASGPFAADSMILLTDGTVLVHNAYGKEWRRLTPDAQGNYANGSWSAEIDMLNTRQFFASGVFMDGRVFAIGGEYSDAGADTPRAEIFDPSTSTWSALSKPSFDWIQGDAACCVIADGRVLLGSIHDQRSAIFDPDANLWTEAGKSHGTSAETKVSQTDEETWTLLPDGTVLTVEVNNPNAAEKYLPNQDRWVSASATPQPLPLASVAGVAVDEIGPAVLLPNGSLFAVGATGHTALYQADADPTQPGRWSPGPDFPNDANGNILTAIDAPACLLPNGKVLCVAGSTVPENDDQGRTTYWSHPTIFFEYDPNANNLTQLSPAQQQATNDKDTWMGRLLLLPTGQVLFTSQQNQIAIYSPDGQPNLGWRPKITSCPTALTAGDSYILIGQQLNGLSQAVSYGDDFTAATNYPLVRLQQGVNVRYCRTFAFSTLGVATGAAAVSTRFQVPSDALVGTSQLAVVANGIASDPITVAVAAPVSH